MGIQKIDIETKVANNGADDSGKLSAEEFNKVVSQANKVIKGHNDLGPAIRRLVRGTIKPTSTPGDIYLWRGVIRVPGFYDTQEEAWEVVQNLILPKLDPSRWNIPTMSDLISGSNCFSSRDDLWFLYAVNVTDVRLVVPYITINESGHFEVFENRGPVSFVRPETFNPKIIEFGKEYGGYQSPWFHATSSEIFRYRLHQPRKWVIQKKTRNHPSSCDELPAGRLFGKGGKPTPRWTYDLAMPRGKEAVPIRVRPRRCEHTFWRWQYFILYWRKDGLWAKSLDTFGITKICDL